MAAGSLSLPASVDCVFSVTSQNNAKIWRAARRSIATAWVMRRHKTRAA